MSTKKPYRAPAVKTSSLSCPRCEKPLTAGHRIGSGNSEPVVPEVGSITVCAYCGAFSELRDGPTWHLLSDAEFDALNPYEQDALVQGRFIARNAAAKLGRKFPFVKGAPGKGR